MKLVKPQRLKEGDTVAFVSPSSGMAGKVPHRIEQAKAMLQSLGFKVVLSKHALQTRGDVSGTPEERVEDLHEMFLNDKVKAIISCIGGENSNQLVEMLDYKLIRNHPKIFMGYSDISVLHYAIHTKAGLVTFYGPAAVTQLGEYPETLSYTVEYLKKALMSDRPIGTVSPSKQCTEEIRNWFAKEDLERPRKLNSNPGWRWLREGKANGPMMGGCIPSICHVRGTDYWPDHKGAIFFVETPEGQDFRKGEPVSSIDANLQDLRLSGVFDEISGLIVGRAFQYNKEEAEQLKRVVLERTSGYDFPILYGVDIGHTDPMITVPLGVKARIDSRKNLFSIEETGTRV